jgi:RNA-dependent RNA polymerase
MFGTPVTRALLQVRIRGCKGVLSRNSRLSGKQVAVRPSMDNFGSTHPQLEVCSAAAWLPSYLNRQVITMMVHNKVPQQVRGFGEGGTATVLQGTNS